MVYIGAVAEDGLHVEVAAKVSAVHAGHGQPKALPRHGLDPDIRLQPIPFNCTYRVTYCEIDCYGFQQIVNILSRSESRLTVVYA